MSEKMLFGDLKPGEIVIVDVEGEGEDAKFTIRGEFKGELSDIEIAPIDAAGVSE
jgi:ATP-dependent Clp protease ATP-binding subunit ClpC